MGDATVRKLVQLLSPAAASELRQAAALVLGEVGGRDRDVAQALIDALNDPDPAFRRPVLQSVARLRIERALPRLLEMISQGGPEAEAAAQSAAALGARATEALRDLMNGAAPGLRRRIAAALGTGGTASADAAALDALLDADPGVVDAATRALIAKVPSLDAKHRRSLGDAIFSLLKDKKARRRLASDVALLRLLAALEDPRGEATFWSYTDARQAAELRAAALQAIGALRPPTAHERIKQLLQAAGSPDFRIAAPALMILKRLDVPDRQLRDWLALLDAPDAAARRFVIDKLHGRSNPDFAAALARQLHQPDKTVRAAALTELEQTEAGRTALVRELLDAPAPDSAWVLARAQVPFAATLSTSLRKEIFTRACRYLDDGDRRADALLFLLREADARQLRHWLDERAVGLRKKKNYAAAMPYFRLLTRDPACGESSRFEAAGCAVKLSAHDLASDARQADPALHLFATLLHRHETEPIRLVEAARWLDAEDLFYLGFHFAERAQPERDFGAQLLQLLIKRAGRTKLAKDAKSKLRSHALD